MNDRSRPKAAPEAPAKMSSSSLTPGWCRVCGVELPDGHTYCIRVHAMWNRQEHLGREVDEPAEDWSP